jgi:hypothetical protein
MVMMRFSCNVDVDGDGNHQPLMAIVIAPSLS